MWVNTLQQLIGHHRHTPQIRHTAAHLRNGVVRVHRPHRLNTAALLIAEEHGKRCHAWALEEKLDGLRCEECSPVHRCDDGQAVMTAPDA